MTLRKLIDNILDFDLSMAVGVIFVITILFLCILVMDFFSKRG